MGASSVLAVVLALLLLLLVAFAPAPAAAANPSEHPGQPPLFPAGISSQQQQQRAASSRGRYAAATDNGTAKPFTAHYFPQELDHFTFTPNSSHVFSQKYLLNDTFWRKPTGPLFVYMGGEADVEWLATNTGFMFDIAPKFRALIVFIEHRFYGESKPFGNDSYKSPDRLGYLTSTQALADFAILITNLKQNISAIDAPVIVFGGSYGGTFILMEGTRGVIPSSDDITPWSSFYDTVSQDFKSESLNCFNVIKAVWDVLDHIGSNDTGLLELSKTFRTCKNVQFLYSLSGWLRTAFINTAMMDYPTPANFLMNLPAYPVKEMCKIIDSFPTGADVIDKAFAAASLYYNYTGDQKCFQMEGGDDPHGLDGWGWQACTEMVMPMTVSNESMFPPSSFSYEKRSEGCLVGYRVHPRMHWITTEYGGHKIDKVLKRFGSNIIFSNGMRDPWSGSGVLKNISSSIIALVTEKGAHHLDLRSATNDDPDWVVEQRRQEVEIIEGWIDQYNKDIAQM